MNILDYLRLGTTNILAHKKRCFTVIIIISTIISILTAGILVIQGTENIVLSHNNYLTKGKVLLLTTTDDPDTKTSKIQTKIAEYQGEIIPVSSYRQNYSLYHTLPTSILHEDIANQLTQVPSDTLPLLISTKNAAEWLQISLPDSNQSATQKIKIIEKIHNQALHQTITDQHLIQPVDETANRPKFYVLALSPSGVGISNLNLGAVNQEGNPLNLLLSNISASYSETFLIESPQIRQQLGDPIATPEYIWTLFPDSEAAYAYTQDSAFYCDNFLLYQDKCPATFLGQITPVLGNPLQPVEVFQVVHTIYNVLCLVLMAIALITVISTFSRLIAQDSKVISLYYATGATKHQVRLIYLTYLLCISLLASLFAIFVGTILALILNLYNATPLSQIFSLAFGTKPESIMLIGWNFSILYLILALLITTVLTLFINNHQFSHRKLARKLK